MKKMIALATLLAMSAAGGAFAETPGITHYASSQAAPAGVTMPTPPFSAAVRAGDTVYISGVIDLDPVTHKPAASPEEGARLAMDAFKASVEKAGLTMDDVVQVQVFCTDLSYFAAFNTVYRTYFKPGMMPARAFVGAANLLAGGHFEVMGIAYAPKK